MLTSTTLETILIVWLVGILTLNSLYILWALVKQIPSLIRSLLNLLKA